MVVEWKEENEWEWRGQTVFPFPAHFMSPFDYTSCSTKITYYFATYSAYLLSSSICPSQTYCRTGGLGVPPEWKSDVPQTAARSNASEACIKDTP